jgi:histone-lysine N-methyltransferase SETMAR
MRKICAKKVLRNLTEQQWDVRLSVCADLLEEVEAEPMSMDRVISCNERWFFQYDPETKCQSLEWCSKGSPRPKKARMSKSKEKCMLVCFFDSMGIVHKEWTPAGQKFSQYYYIEILERLRKRVLQVCRHIEKNWILHHNNAPAHAVLFVTQFLTSKCVTVMPQPPYSPDLVPCVFFVFQKIKSAVKGYHFE